MVTLPRALGNVTDYLTAPVPDALIHNAWADAEYPWRERPLGPLVTTYRFLKRVLHGHTARAHRRQSNCQMLWMTPDSGGVGLLHPIDKPHPGDHLG